MFAARNLFLTGQPRRVDPDATAYIDLLVAAGATVSGTQTAAIDQFIRDEKEAGRWSILRRMYLPIWGVAAANAICMISRTSGTFFGGVTHGAGFVRSDGTTGYFVPNGTNSTWGISPGNSMLMSASWSEDPDHDASGGNRGIGQDSAGPRISLVASGAFNQFRSVGYQSPSFANRTLSSAYDGTIAGVRVGSSMSTSLRRSILRKASSFYEGLSTSTDSNSFQSNRQVSFMALLNDSSPSSWQIADDFAWAIGLGMTQTQMRDYSLAVKTLGEAMTGLTIPA